MVVDAVLIQLASEPVVTVEVDLNRKREPGRDSQMHETEFGIDEIEVQAQTLTPGTDQTGTPLSRDKSEALAGFHRTQDADEPLSDPIGLSDFPGFFLLPNLPVEVDVRPPALLGHGPGMLLESLGVPRHEFLEFFEQETLVAHKPLHGLRPTDRQVSFEKNPIKTGYRSRDFSCMLIDKLFRGVLPPSVAVLRLPHYWMNAISFSTSIWLRP